MRAKKEMGQHFLIQESIAERLANSLPLEGCDGIVESRSRERYFDKIFNPAFTSFGGR
jgi:hypothetical protein